MLYYIMHNRHRRVENRKYQKNNNRSLRAYKTIVVCTVLFLLYIGRSGQHINLFPVMGREGVEHTKDPPFVPCIGTVHDSSLIRRFCRAEWFSISFSIYDITYIYRYLLHKTNISTYLYNKG